MDAIIAELITNAPVAGLFAYFIWLFAKRLDAVTAAIVDLTVELRALTKYIDYRKGTG